MSILSPLTGFLRSALDVVEHEGAQAAAQSPLGATIAAEKELDRLALALRGAARSADRQVELLDGVARSLPTLTAQLAELSARIGAMNEHVVGLNRQLEELAALLAPLASVEHEESRLERLFRRRRRDGAPSGMVQP